MPDANDPARGAPAVARMKEPALVFFNEGIRASRYRSMHGHGFGICFLGTPFAERERKVVKLNATGAPAF